jgi:hypothetical protein
MISLIIKGNFYDARRALDERKLLTCMALREVSKWNGMTNEVCAIVDNERAADVVAWFVAPGAIVPGKGYPPGTLLYYSCYESRTISEQREREDKP